MNSGDYDEQQSNNIKKRQNILEAPHPLLRFKTEGAKMCKKSKLISETITQREIYKEILYKRNTWFEDKSNNPTFLIR